MLEQLKKQVCNANLDLVKEGLVLQTWGNASGIDRQRGLVVIKPSGVPYPGMKPKHMVVVSLASGKVIEGDMRPSSDTATHLVLYRAFKHIGGSPHSQPLRDRLGAGLPRGPRARHNPRRLFSRSGALHAVIDTARDSK